MTLPAYATTLDEIPEAARGLYVETGEGGFRLDAEGIEDVSGLKSALEKERTARKALKAELDAASGEGAAAPDGRLAALEAALISAEARAAILAEGGIAELLVPIVAPRLAAVEEAGGIRLAVRGADGGERRTPDGATAMTARDLVQELRAQPAYARAFDLPAKGGSGAPSHGRAAAPLDIVSITDQAALDRNVADIASGRIRVGR